MVRVAVVLSGCGHLDGAEIREAVIALLALDRMGAEVCLFAPDITQFHVVNHLTGEVAVGEERNVLVESARIARGDILDLSQLVVDRFDALVLPGGYGVAKNLSDLAFAGENVQVTPDFSEVLHGFFKMSKPIGAICISPAVLVKALSDVAALTVTIGDDDDGLVARVGGMHTLCATDMIVVDEAHCIVSCSAYMRDASISEVADGIEALVKQLVTMAKGITGHVAID